MSAGILPDPTRSAKKRHLSVKRPEPLLCDPVGQSRFVIIPGSVDYKDVIEMTKKHRFTYWVPEEIGLAADLADWDLLEKEEKHFIKMALAFFAASDGIVIENLATKFLCEVKIPEVRMFYCHQLAMEAIHADTYSLLIDTYINKETEKDNLFNAIKKFPAIELKAKWAMKYIESTESFAIRLVAFAVVEGIFFSGSFCSIYWLKKRGLMPGLCLSNELISRDEGIHTDFACLLFSKLEHKPARATIHKIVREAVEIEKEFVTESLPVSLIGMNKERMAKYIMFIADKLLVSLKVPKLYYADNPFPWMEAISLEGKTNFFERRVGEYQHASERSPSKGVDFSVEY